MKIETLEQAVEVLNRERWRRVDCWEVSPKHAVTRVHSIEGCDYVGQSISASEAIFIAQAYEDRRELERMGKGG